MTDGDARLTCFIAMPMTTRPEDAAAYGDEDHWNHVMEHFFVPTIEKAGLTPVRPIARGSSMIHAGIIQNLENADMVLCDMSGHNPNVFFELGVRTSLDKPIAIVRDEKTTIPFDLGGLNAHPYKSHLNLWELPEQMERLESHLQAAITTCDGRNPLWAQYGLTKRAETPTSDEDGIGARLDLILTRVGQLEGEQRRRRDEAVLAAAWRANRTLAEEREVIATAIRNFAADLESYAASRAIGDVTVNQVDRSHRVTVDVSGHLVSNDDVRFMQDLATEQGLQVLAVRST